MIIGIIYTVLAVFFFVYYLMCVMIGSPGQKNLGQDGKDSITIIAVLSGGAIAWPFVLIVAWVAT